MSGDAFAASGYGATVFTRLHSDFKPANVMVTTDSRVKVLDFGVATDVGAKHLADCTLTAAGRTVAGTILGTPAYMSPEQIEGRTVDHRSDIFSFGVVVYERATGSRAFQADNVAGPMTSILRDTPLPAGALRRKLPSLQPCDPQLVWTFATDFANTISSRGDASIQIGKSRSNGRRSAFVFDAGRRRLLRRAPAAELARGDEQAGAD